VSDNVERLNLYRKLSEASTFKQIDDWEEELSDRFGPLPENAAYLSLATRIKLAASRCLVKKVTIRAGRMWLQFPKNDSDLGEKFYGGYFQSLLQDVEKLSGKSYEVIQKKDAVRIVVHDIAGSSAALDYLQRLGRFIDEKEPAAV
jgi:transcription-repair coupling factor (superfamily II helicase)